MYCIRDVETLSSIVITFIKSYMSVAKTGQIGSYRDYITISRLSMITWYKDKQMNDRSIIRVKSNSGMYKFLSKSYYGGQTEIYKGMLDKGCKCYYYDFSRMYGKAMTLPLPVGSPIYIREMGLKDAESFIGDLHANGLCGFFKVKFTCPDTLRPVLPVKGRLQNKGLKLIFCTGSSVGVYYRYELEIAMKRGYSVDIIIEGYVFTSGKPLKKYSEILIEKKRWAKESGNHVIEMVYKSLATNLYGKFAINLTLKTSLIHDLDVKTIKDLYRRIEIKDTEMRIVEEYDVNMSRKSKNTNISISRAITS